MMIKAMFSLERMIYFRNWEYYTIRSKTYGEVSYSKLKYSAISS